MKIAYVFPGQGAQQANMGMDFCDYSPAYKKVFETLCEESGFDLKNAIVTGENLSMTEYTQPALYTMGMALTAMLEEKGVAPAICAGLSLGEYGALSAAGSLNILDGVKLLRKRGRFMQEAVPAGQGTLAAIIGLNLEAVKEVAAAAGVYVSNYNLEQQIVVGGETALVEKACVLAKEKGAKLTKMLDVSAPFHTPMLKGAGEKLGAELAKVAFAAPGCAVYANCTGKTYGAGDDIRGSLETQVSSTVLWYDCMAGMAADGVDLYLELGPGSTLAAMIKKVDKQAKVISVNTPKDFESALEAIG